MSWWTSLAIVIIGAASAAAQLPEKTVVLTFDESR